MTIGIYLIKHIASGKVYIGQSRNIENRWRHYKRLYCMGQKKIYNALVKYGIEAFEYKVLYICDPEDLDRVEESCIKAYKAATEGYNICHKASGKGYHSEETKLKIGAAHKGKVLGPRGPMSEETKAKLRAFNKGKSKSLEHRAKLSAAASGKKRSNKGRWAK